MKSADMIMAPNPDVAHVRSAICAEASQTAAGQYRDTIIAMVLTGSLARDEATVISGNGMVRILGDADFLLVFRQNCSLPSDPEICVLQRTIEAKLRRRSIECSIGISAVVPAYFRSLPPRIFTYELRRCGIVIWGDTDVLSLIPACGPSDVTLEDGWCLLCNRMIEFLEVAHELQNAALHYRTVKLYLDMGTSYLIMQGCYEPTYRGRAERLRMLANGSDVRAPLELRPFSERVTFCANLKLCNLPLAPLHHGQAFESNQPSWEQAIRDARALWRFQLMRLTDAQPDVPDCELMRSWIARQAVGQRLRGWLSVVRHSGYVRSWREWPRWIRNACRASPRYLLYASAAELLFQLPALVAASPSRSDCDGLNIFRELPIRCRLKRSEQWPAWRKAAYEIAWIYHEFLEKTRA